MSGNGMQQEEGALPISANVVGQMVSALTANVHPEAPAKIC